MSKIQYTLKESQTKEDWREYIEYKAQELRVEAKILEARASTMEHMAREVYYKLEEVESDLTPNNNKEEIDDE